MAASESVVDAQKAEVGIIHMVVTVDSPLTISRTDDAQELAAHCEGALLLSLTWEAHLSTSINWQTTKILHLTSHVMPRSRHNLTWSSL